MTNVISFQLDVHVESLVGKISDKPHKILNGFGCRLWLWPQIMYLLKDIGGLGGGDPIYTLSQGFWCLSFASLELIGATAHL